MPDRYQSFLDVTILPTLVEISFAGFGVLAHSLKSSDSLLICSWIFFCRYFSFFRSSSLALVSGLAAPRFGLAELGNLASPVWRENLDRIFHAASDILDFGLTSLVEFLNVFNDF